MFVLLQGARCELVPQPLEAAPDAPVDESVADSDDDAAEEVGVDRRLQGDRAACQLLEPCRDRPDLFGSERRGARCGGVGQSIALVVEPPELRRDARQLLDPATPRAV